MRVTYAILGLSVSLAACSSSPEPEPSQEPVEVMFLDQGWSAEERQDFYHRSQGSRLLKYSWYLALERGVGDDRKFSDPDYMESIGFIPGHNPGDLPVGFAKDVDADGEEWWGLTCAACHTGQMTYQGHTIRIDGGGGRPDLDRFSTTLFRAMTGLEAAVVEDDIASLFPGRDGAHFARLATEVLGEGHSEEARDRLHTEVSARFRQMAQLGFFTITRDLQPLEGGFGRTDALGTGGNTLFGQITPDNLRTVDGQVRIPEIWDGPSFDWAQYAGAIAQPMGRNVAETLGVFSQIDFAEGSNQYTSSVPVDNLQWMEEALRELRSPPWPDVFPPIDEASAVRGAELYASLCQSCHEFEPLDDGRLQVKMFPQEYMGTDPTFLLNFASREVDTAQLGLGTLSAAEALTQITNRVIARKYADMGLSEEDIAEMNCCAENEFRATPSNGVPSVRGRPLNGAWASAPYLHNGSVPNMYQLLGPADARATTFYAGNPEFDPVNLGYVSADDGDWTEFDTTLEGNSNAGHEFRDGELGNGVVGRALSDAERLDIIEYVKTLTDAAGSSTLAGEQD